jgi:hypothetical protein
MLFLLFYYCICAATFVEYVAFIFSGVVSALLASVFRVYFGYVYLHDVLRTCCYLVFVSCSALNIGLCMSRFCHSFAG